VGAVVPRPLQNCKKDKPVIYFQLSVFGIALAFGVISDASAQSAALNDPVAGVSAGASAGAGAQAAAVTSPTFNFMGDPAERSINQRLTTTPSMSAPNVFSSNPCVISASGAVSAMGFGMALGAGVEDRECTRRAHAALLAQMGLPRAAAEVLCHNGEVRAAMAVAGVPCAADRPTNTIMPNPPQPPGSNFTGTATPAAAARAPMMDGTGMPVVAASTSTPPRVRPDWCFTASVEERQVRPGMC